MGMLLQVDAALDLSHTQNIGYVLKNHFARSQFLVVSVLTAGLKDLQPLLLSLASSFWPLLYMSRSCNQGQVCNNKLKRR